MASWGADHTALARIHHDDILRQAREGYQSRLATRGRQSRFGRYLAFPITLRPRHSVRPAPADLLMTRV